MKFIDAFLETIYPTKCFLCGRIQQEGICVRCKRKLEIINPMMYNRVINKNRDKYYKEHIYMFKYEGLIRKKIIDFKFNDQPYISKGLANLIINNKKIYVLFKKYDIIVPVPIHKKRKKCRGYNQCEILAKAIIEHINSLDIETKALIKHKNIVAQSSLNGYERKYNIVDAYRVIDKEKIEGKNIILIDDIFTTGSTVSECSKVLKQAGAKEIMVFTVAKD